MCHDAGPQLTARKLLYRDRATAPFTLRKWDAYKDPGPVKEPTHPPKKKELKKEAGGTLIRRDERIGDRWEKSAKWQGESEGHMEARTDDGEAVSRGKIEILRAHPAALTVLQVKACWQCWVQGHRDGFSGYLWIICFSVSSYLYLNCWAWNDHGHRKRICQYSKQTQQWSLTSCIWGRRSLASLFFWASLCHLSSGGWWVPNMTKSALFLCP